MSDDEVVIPVPDGDGWSGDKVKRMVRNALENERVRHAGTAASKQWRLLRELVKERDS